jgi:hypothetical protein
MEQLEELRGKDLIRKLDSGGFVRHLLDVKTGMYSINRLIVLLYRQCFD